MKRPGFEMGLSWVCVVTRLPVCLAQDGGCQVKGITQYFIETSV